MHIDTGFNDGRSHYFACVSRCSALFIHWIDFSNLLLCAKKKRNLILAFLNDIAFSPQIYDSADSHLSERAESSESIDVCREFYQKAQSYLRNFKPHKISANISALFDHMLLHYHSAANHE